MMLVKPFLILCTAVFIVVPFIELKAQDDLICMHPDTISFSLQRGESVSEFIKIQRNTKDTYRSINYGSIHPGSGTETKFPHIPLEDLQYTLRVDDDSQEALLGDAQELQMMYFNRFTPPAADYPLIIDSAFVLFDSPGGVSVGDTIDLHVYGDADGNPANGAVLIASTLNQVVQFADGLTHSRYALSSPILASGPGDILLGVVNRTAGTNLGDLPFSFDTTVPVNRTWKATYSGPPPMFPPIPPPPANNESSAGELIQITGGNFMAHLLARTFNCGTSGVDPRYTVCPTGGTLDPGEDCDTIEVKIEVPTDAPLGTYEYDVIIAVTETALNTESDIILDMDTLRSTVTVVGTPDIRGPQPQSFTIGPYDSCSTELLIRNVGSDTLAWFVADTCSWLAVGPSFGTTLPGMQDTVTLGVIGDSMQAGIHNCSIGIISNDPDTPLWIVPVVAESITQDWDISLDYTVNGGIIFEPPSTADYPAELAVSSLACGGGSIRIKIQMETPNGTIIPIVDPPRQLNGVPGGLTVTRNPRFVLNPNAGWFDTGTFYFHCWLIRPVFGDTVATYTSTFDVIPATSLTDSLVAYYPFIGNANDASGNGNDGTVFGATLSEDRLGRVNRAYSFDGINDFIDCGNSPSLDVAEEITLAMWIKVDSLGNDSRGILSKRQSFAINNAFSVVLKANDLPFEFQVPTDCAFDPADSSESASTAWVPTTGQWYHLAGVYKNNDAIRIYVDGVLEGISEAQSGSVCVSPGNLILGAIEDFGLHNFFAGSLDEVRLYDRGLSQPEIIALFNDLSIEPEVEEAQSAALTGTVPGRLQLLQNYPNPFNPSTVITFELPEPNDVTLRIFDVNGRLVRLLIGQEQRAAGTYHVSWDGLDSAGSQAASGVYFYRLSTNQGRTETRKMMLLR